MQSETDRDKVCDQYDGWLAAKLGERADVQLVAEFQRLLNLAKDGDLTLLCWCTPKRCHC